MNKVKLTINEVKVSSGNVIKTFIYDILDLETYDTVGSIQIDKIENLAYNTHILKEVDPVYKELADFLVKNNMLYIPVIAFIKGIYIDKDYRKKSFGTDSIRYLEEELKLNEIYQVVLLSKGMKIDSDDFDMPDTDSNSVLALYQNLNYKEYEDTYFMTKKINKI